MDRVARVLVVGSYNADLVAFGDRVPRLGETVMADIIDRKTAPAGATFTGPAVVTEEQTTTYVPPGFSGTINPSFHLIIERQEDK